MGSPDRYPALLDYAQDLFLVLAPDGTIRYANAAAERILGYDPDDLVGVDAFEVIHPDDRAETRGTFDRLVESDGAVDQVEHRTLAADGSWVWLQSRMEGTTDADLDGYVVSARDVTDRKREEVDHEATRARLEELTAATDDVLWMFTADWEELLFVNDAFEDLWGMDIETVREEPQQFLEGVHPEDRPAVEAAMQELSAGERVDIEYRVNPEREYRRWVWVQGVPIVEDSEGSVTPRTSDDAADGEVVRIVGFARDVTDRRRRERQLRVIDRLLRHNLRNDMNVILGHAELAREQSTGVVAESMETVIRTGEGLLATAAKERSIVNLLSEPTPRRPMQVLALVEAAVEHVRAAHPAATVELSCPDDVEVSTVPELQLALEELLENAIVHTAEAEPTVLVTVEHDDDTAQLCVTDVGPAIPDNEVEMLSDDVSDVFHGTGLGLWLVFWVVDLADGDIEFRRDPERGNCVALTLPRVCD
jgi:PAS domain S-box-containing protein